MSGHHDLLDAGALQLSLDPCKEAICRPLERRLESTVHLDALCTRSLSAGDHRTNMNARTSGSLWDALGIYTFQEELRVVQYRKTMSGVVRICYEICVLLTYILSGSVPWCATTRLWSAVSCAIKSETPVKWMPSGRAEPTHIMG
jgi:hypothetical protein